MAWHRAQGTGHGAHSQKGHDGMPVGMPFVMWHIWTLAIDSIHRTIVTMIILAE